MQSYLLSLLRQLGNASDPCLHILRPGARVKPLVNVRRCTKMTKRLFTSHAVACWVTVAMAAPLAAQLSDSPPSLPVIPPFNRTSEASTPNAFRHIVPIGTAAMPSSAFANRERVDQFNTDWFAAPTRLLAFDLFQDASVTAVIDDFEIIQGVEVFYGHVNGADERLVMIARQNGTVQARISAPDGRVFEVTSSDDMACKIIELDTEKLADGIRADVEFDHPGAAVIDANSTTTSNDSTVAPNDSHGTVSALTVSAQPIIDVMVLYTPEQVSNLGS